MKLDPRSWLHHAKTLAVGEKQRFDHDCGPGRTLLCEHKKLGYSAYCWRCGEDGWVPHPAESLAAKIKRLNAAKEAEHEAINSMYLPKPFVTEPSEWPDEARVWLYKSGMSDEDIKGLGFYWNPRLERVVMPVVSASGALSYWQARSFNPEAPKYINPSIDKSGLVARYGPTNVRELVLTEDILSAWKVGSAGYTAWCILGTSFPQLLLRETISRRDKRVLVWLDPDKAGQRGTHKIMKQLRAYGMEALRINSDADPKLLPRTEIKRIIRERLKKETA